MLGLEAAEHVLIEAFRAAAATPLVKGFAIGRTIFALAAEGWFAGTMDDDAAVSDMARRFESLTDAWRAAVADATAE
jgi:5-dehydro-2-deoxygluconokinase